MAFVSFVALIYAYNLASVSHFYFAGYMRSCILNKGSCFAVLYAVQALMIEYWVESHHLQVTSVSSSLAIPDLRLSLVPDRDQFRN